ncbi:MAG: glycosyltransferase, partial [Firmicutes bacterium]|nr:glycosyltransferase [Bacillota bacterium]
MIARDEAALIASCLESVRHLVREMVVVDTGSTDETPEVARRHGARVFRFPWRDDFAAARNYALARAT